MGVCNSLVQVDLIGLHTGLVSLSVRVLSQSSSHQLHSTFTKQSLTSLYIYTAVTNFTFTQQSPTSLYIYTAVTNFTLHLPASLYIYTAITNFTLHLHSSHQLHSTFTQLSPTSLYTAVTNFTLHLPASLYIYTAINFTLHLYSRNKHSN